MHTGVPRNRSGGVSLYAPVYTYFLAACYTVGGVRLWSVAVPQAVMAGLLAWFTGLAAARLAPKFYPWAMWLGAVLVLVNLRFAMSTAMVTPTIPLLLLMAVVVYLAAGEPKWGGVLGLSAAVAVAIFTQTSFFVVGFAITLWLAWQFVRRKNLAFALGCCLIFSSIGAMLLLRAVVAKMGDSHKHENTVILWEANNPYYESLSPTGLWGRRPGNPWSQWQPSPEEQQRYNDYLQRGAKSGRNPAVLWIKENPIKYAKLCFIRLYTTLGPMTGQMSPRNRIVSAFYWMLIFPAGFYGLWRTRRLRTTHMAVLIFLVLSSFETLVITEWYLRYRMPWELVLSIYAAVGYLCVLYRGNTPLLPGSGDPQNEDRQTLPDAKDRAHVVYN